MKILAILSLAAGLAIGACSTTEYAQVDGKDCKFGPITPMGGASVVCEGDAGWNTDGADVPNSATMGNTLSNGTMGRAQ